jgi:hypothetical protein
MQQRCVKEERGTMGDDKVTEGLVQRVVWRKRGCGSSKRWLGKSTFVPRSNGSESPAALSRHPVGCHFGTCTAGQRC